VARPENRETERRALKTLFESLSFLTRGADEHRPYRQKKNSEGGRKRDGSQAGVLTPTLPLLMRGRRGLSREG